MKIKDLINLLEDENPKARLILEYKNIELEINDWNIESSDDVVTLQLVDK